ncbi:MAG TPA: DUF6249 domain-containing protein [Puia sp.]|nr:DUF6249 domain-containing protein [Puia sp.]
MEGFQIALIPISICLGFFAMVFGIVYMHKRQNLAMIEKNMDPRIKEHRPTTYQNLKWGLLLVGSGIGLALAYIVTQYVLRTDDPALWFAFIAIGGGIGLILSHRVEKKELLDKGNQQQQ